MKWKTFWKWKSDLSHGEIWIDWPLNVHGYKKWNVWKNHIPNKLKNVFSGHSPVDDSNVFGLTDAESANLRPQIANKLITPTTDIIFLVFILEIKITITNKKCFRVLLWWTLEITITSYDTGSRVVPDIYIVLASNANEIENEMKWRKNKTRCAKEIVVSQCGPASKKSNAKESLSFWIRFIRAESVNLAHWERGKSTKKLFSQSSYLFCTFRTHFKSKTQRKQCTIRNVQAEFIRNLHFYSNVIEV